MKHLIKYSIIVLLLSLSIVAVPIDKASAQGGEVSFQIFYDQLSPYGHWVDFPDEGYVWIPNDQAGFAPYQTNGYWAYTDYGWTWVSNYPWGWATFHYGRWDFDDDYGWYWVPEYEWAPAWVTWAREPGYYGWAPLRPEIDINASITSGYYAPPDHWSYAPAEFLGRRDIDRHFVPRGENNNHIRNSEMINKTFIDDRHTTYAGGPPREEVEKVTKAPVQQLAVVQRSSPGQTVAANQISIYKPVVAPKTGNTNPAPPKLASIRDIKPLPGRTPNQERLNAAPRSAPVQQTEQRANQATPPAMQAQPAPEQNRNVQQPQQRQPPPQTQQQPLPQQRQNPQTNMNAPPQQPRLQQQQPAQPVQRQIQQQPNPQRVQRENRFTAPTYQAPKPSTAPPQIQPHPGAQQRQSPPNMPQPHPAPPQLQQHGQPQGQPKQDGKPH